jgi:hypothetical protein
MSKKDDEKNQSGYYLGDELDGSGSFDTITALVAEGGTLRGVCRSGWFD